MGSGELKTNQPTTLKHHQSFQMRRLTPHNFESQYHGA